ncbi:hypothetical protein ACH5RR_038631 [Cinchona calisaya]|uniref:Uncharacterized protein n=1 Tax=Cinchona calisaya TaxID=153742 RepID=A0ABD2XX70_9GENT
MQNKIQVLTEVSALEGRMLPRRVDHNLNQMHSHDGSIREAFKQKMLSQEYTFKKQVQELHRLYKIQMILMKNLRLQEMSTMQSVNYSFQGISQRPLDAEVSASHYLKHSDHNFLNKGDTLGTKEKPVQLDYCFDCQTDSSSDEVKLSLSIGGDSMRKRSGWKIRDEKPTSISSQYIIDLEESTQMVISRHIEPKSALRCTACSADSGGLCVIQSSCSCQNEVNKDLVNEIKRSQLLVHGNKNCLEQKSINQGVKECLGNVPRIGISSATKVFSSHESASIDLNKPLLDELPFHLNDPAMESLASASSGEGVIVEFHNGSTPDRTSWRKPENNCSNEVSAVILQDTPNFTMMASNSNDSSTIMSGIKSISMDLESCFSSPSEHGEVHDCHIWNHKDKTMTEVNDKRGDEIAMSPHLCRRGDNIEDIDSLPASCKSDCIASDPSSSLKTVQSGTRLEKSDLSRINSFHNSELSQDESSIHGDSKSGSFDEKIEGSANDDALIRKGAVSLMYFMQEISTREDDLIADVDKMKKTEKEKRDQPQRSSDSFESMVLKLQESNVEDYCVSSMPTEVNEMDKKDYGIKLRRGRRLKDFQKDILPGMASLARHEICEDIRIMEGVMRSREYKRLKSKMSISQSWFTPVRSRRSRLTYIGRKYY